MARLRNDERKNTLEQVRQRLLNSAAVEFARDGFLGANINAISKNAGFAKGTIYNYFPSKHALMLALVDAIARNHYEFIVDKVKPEMHPISRLERFFQAGFDFISQNPSQARVAHQIIYGADDALRNYIYQAYQPIFQFVATEILEPGVVQGYFKPLDIKPMTILLMTIYLGTASQLDQQSRPYLDPTQVAGLVLNGLKK